MTISTNTAAHYLQAIKEAETARDSYEAILQASPAYQAMKQAEERAAALRAEARAHFETLPAGVVATEHGKIGYQERKSYTFSPESVREFAPGLVSFVIRETVDGAALKKFVPTVIKTGNAPADLMAQLEARAEVKITKAFICELPKAEG